MAGIVLQNVAYLVFYKFPILFFFSFQVKLSFGFFTIIIVYISLGLLKWGVLRLSIFALKENLNFGEVDKYFMIFLLWKK